MSTTPINCGQVIHARHPLRSTRIPKTKSQSPQPQPFFRDIGIIGEAAIALGLALGLALLLTTFFREREGLALRVLAFLRVVFLFAINLTPL